MKTIRAYWFSDGDKLRYGSALIPAVGVTHKLVNKDRDTELCSWGYHASRRIVDALIYAPGSLLWVVDIKGSIKEQDDKLVGSQRKYIRRVDATDLLFEARRRFAMSHIAKIKPYTKKYNLIVEYLKTGNPKLRAAAESAARSAAESAAESAAWSAARSAARSAAWSAARSAERDAQEIILQQLLEEYTNE